MSLPNTLRQWVIKDDKINSKVRPFSHIASNPKDVKEWIPITFDELHGPVAMDKRTVEFLNHKDIVFHLAMLGNQSYIRCIDYKAVSKSAAAEPQNEVKS